MSLNTYINNLEEKRIYDIYLDIQEKYEKIYGDNTIVLMAVGDFREIYGFNLDEYRKGKALEISSKLNILLTKKNKNKSHAKDNPYMCGFNIHCESRFIELLIDLNYTCIIVDQTTKNEHFNNMNREITQIISPATYLDSNKYSNILLTILFENIKIKNEDKIFCSVSYCDILEGTNTIYEINKIEEYISELYKLISILEPREILIINNKCTLEPIIEELNIKNYKIINYDSKYNSIDFQQLILERIFKNNTQLNIFEYLNLELLNSGRIVYIYLLEFLNEHNHNILQNINKPVLYKDENYIKLDKETIFRLNLVKNNDYDNTNSLLHILNHTKTAIGNRLFKNRLLRPIINSTELNNRYELVDYFIQNNDIIYNKLLENVYDISKLHRFIGMKYIIPKDIQQLYNSYINIQKIIEKLSINETHNIFTLLNFNIEEQELLNNLVQYIDYNINIQETLELSEIIFNKGIHEDIDNINNNIEEYRNIYSYIQQFLSKVIEIEINSTKKKKKLIDDNNIPTHIQIAEKNKTYVLQITPSKAQILKKYIKKNKTEKLNYTIVDICLEDFIIMESSKTKYTIVCSKLDNIMDELIKIKQQYIELVQEYFNKFLDDIYHNYIIKLNNLINFVGDIDLAICNANNAIKMHYTKPQINLEAGKSFIKVDKLRHPIIERILKNTQYISNDIELGINDNDGLLIYGINAAGKSSLMKSIGLCVIMAQAGMYVPGENMIYNPYKSLYTRIGSQDNIFMNRSSFTQEMAELRHIFKTADKNSLIIGDEICSGTEECSAVSLVAASLCLLSEKKSTYIFATHLHKLIDISYIKDLYNLKICHLKITNDNGLIIYNRKLEAGNGSQEYGLMVAGSLNLPEEFIKQATNIRNEVKNEINIFDAKCSHYNKSKVSITCEICEEDKPVDDIHHILYQKNIDEYKYVGEVYINSKYNLTSLCKECHQNVHTNKIIIHGYIETTQGIKLKYEKK